MSFNALALAGAVALVAQPPAPAGSPQPQASASASAPSAAPSALKTDSASFMSSPSTSQGGFCGTAVISPLTVVDSKIANPGQSFTFTVKSLDDPQHRFPTLAAGQTGYGLVAVVRHARAGGDPGLLVLETRYIIASDGSHVPISLVRTVNGLFEGRTRNSPGLLSLIPYVGYVTGTYDALHKGTDVATGPGDTLFVALGDDPVAGTCTIPVPSPSPSASASPAPKPSITVAPAPLPSAA